ncbi:hypothetical protein SEMRO_228_G092780.1 [Seminavis robusta]|uniref:Uncharacterized protein n=1 Tax=Seminavis robusta TaxID=568900 RepID=A0A9N8H8S0_9STRA|nr:hypothetical protein SEMRO_228_G092780.1 [Seminavis robusta]|eukprot:Sro228_g092780.1 n/a (132) ;mRNA; f:70267-70662
MQHGITKRNTGTLPDLPDEHMTSTLWHSGEEDQEAQHQPVGDSHEQETTCNVFADKPTAAASSRHEPLDAFAPLPRSTVSSSNDLNAGLVEAMPAAEDYNEQLLQKAQKMDPEVLEQKHLVESMKQEKERE